MIMFLSMTQLLLFGSIRCESLCPDLCSCTNMDLISVNCWKANLTTIPNTLNPAIQILKLNYNHLMEIGSASFHFHPELTEVDLANNQLVEIQDNTFEAQENLLKMNLSKNHLRLINSEAFCGLRNLHVLDLSENNFQSITGFMFKHLLNLKKLDLSSNRITNVDDDTFAGLSSLVTLAINKNNLLRIPATAFHHLAGLTVLGIKQNKVQEVDEDALAYLDKLTVLDLSDNPVTYLSELSFSGLGSLETLDLSGGNLSRVPTAALDQLSELQYLHLNRNKFEEIPRNALRGLKQLRYLHISECPRLRVVRTEAFNDNTELIDVTIAGNKNLDNIEDDVFSHLKKMKSLNINNNSLSSVNLTVVSLPSLTHLQTRSNPWTCDCYIQPLQLLIQTLGPGQDRPKCDTPPHLQGEMLTSVSMSACKPGNAAAAVALETSADNQVSVAMVSTGVCGVVVVGVVVVVMVYLCGGRHKVNMFMDQRRRVGQEGKLSINLVEQEEEWFVSVKEKEERLEDVSVPVTEL